GFHQRSNIMILLYIEKKQYMYEDYDLEKALDAAGTAVREGKAVQIIPDTSKISNSEISKATTDFERP
ncbi:MAG: hypothetical protein K2N43_03295, partial [Lachnospiraceae bacterium]|nr:hypothetical protein [Lachnospiraceae bacterium]